MAGEVTVIANLRVVAGPTQYVSRPTSFIGNIVGHVGTGSVGAIGPTPGAFLIATAGTTPSLTQLSEPGYFRIANYDQNNFYEIGLTISATFYPLLEVQPNEVYVARFSRNLDPTKLTFKAHSASVEGLLECFQA